MLFSELCSSFKGAKVSYEKKRELSAILVFLCLVTALLCSLLLLICVKKEEGDLSGAFKPLTLAFLEKESGVKNLRETDLRVA